MLIQLIQKRLINCGSALIKAIILRCLSKRSQQWLWNIYYFYLVKRFDEEKEKDLGVVKLIVERNDYVVDVGANVGIYTIFLSNYVGRRGRVFSIEPVKRNYEILCFIIFKMKLVNVNLFRVALSDCITEGRMLIPRNKLGIENYYQAAVVKNKRSGEKGEAVILETLDHIVEKEENSFRFIKCDVEGHEVQVIKGALKTILRDKPALLIEVKDSYHELHELLAPLGYIAFWTNGKKIHDYSPDCGCPRANLFFLQIQHLECLQSLR